VDVLDSKTYVVIITSLLILLMGAMNVLSIDIPLEEPIENYTIEGNEGNTTLFEYSTESIKLIDDGENKSLLNYLEVNTTLSLGAFKWKSINRLLYLNETDYEENISFILTFRKGSNESDINTLSNDYNLNTSKAFFISTIGQGETPWPPDNDMLDTIEESIANYTQIYHNVSNFTLIEEYRGFKATGDISSIIDLLYHNNTLDIDPGPYDLINDYPNATYTPTSYLYYEYINFTSCNDSLRTSGNDVDNDLFAVCEGDCNDSNVNIHPGVVELWDGVDNDCDGVVDEGIVNCAGVQPNYAGDWNITSNTTCNETVINLSSGTDVGTDVFINEDVVLFLDNSTLYLDPSPGDDAVIWLDGILKLLDSITDWLT